jgi:hypothetical protein
VASSPLSTGSTSRIYSTLTFPWSSSSAPCTPSASRSSSPSSRRTSLYISPGLQRRKALTDRTMTPISPVEAASVRKFNLCSRLGWRRLTKEAGPHHRLARTTEHHSPLGAKKEEDGLWETTINIGHEANAKPDVLSKSSPRPCDEPHCMDERCLHSLSSPKLDSIASSFENTTPSDRITLWRSGAHNPY